MEKLAFFWKQSNCTPRQKILVYDAVIRSKLLYGLESAELRPSDLTKLDTFQLKGLRQILKLKTTYATIDTPQGPKPVIHRENTNKKVFEAANRISKEEKEHAKEIIPISEVYTRRKTEFLEKILLAPDNDPILRTTLNPSTLAPHKYGKRVIGKPKTIWANAALQEYWSRTKHLHQDNLGEVFRPTLDSHRDQIRKLVANKAIFSLRRGGRQPPPTQSLIAPTETTIVIREPIDSLPPPLVGPAAARDSERCCSAGSQKKTQIFGAFEG